MLIIFLIKITKIVIQVVEIFKQKIIKLLFHTQVIESETS